MLPSWFNALMGGLIIGVSVSLMLLWNGRVTGISGILYGLFGKPNGDTWWRASFIGGLLSGGLVLQVLNPQSFGVNHLPIDWTVIAAGILVGFGTVLGSGCTSGHGVCGVSRFSVRSIVATLIFISFGVIAVSFFKNGGT